MAKGEGKGKDKAGHGGEYSRGQDKGLAQSLEWPGEDAEAAQESRFGCLFTLSAEKARLRFLREASGWQFLGEAPRWRFLGEAT